jgi:hypothetical protein
VDYRFTPINTRVTGTSPAGYIKIRGTCKCRAPYFELIRGGNRFVGLNGDFADLIKVQMKRILMLAMIVAFVMIPLVSFAKTAISDSDLDAVTAKAGISIVFTNLTISSLSLSKGISWGDSDGVPDSPYYTGSYTNAGYIGATDITVQGDLINYTGAMNIDVGTSGGVTKVQIVLPNEITIGGTAGMNITATLRLGDTKTLDNGTNAPALATIAMKGFQTFVSGTVTVFAH